MYTCSLENNEVKARPLDVYIFLVSLLAFIWYISSIPRSLHAMDTLLYYEFVRILSLLLEDNQNVLLARLSK